MTVLENSVFGLETDCRSSTPTDIQPTRTWRATVAPNKNVADLRVGPIFFVKRRFICVGGGCFNGGTMPRVHRI